MYGAIIGDVVGSRFEFHNHRSKEFELITNECEFTDDTILTVAIMDWAVNSEVRDSYSVVEYLQKWGRKYPSSYGGRFAQWLFSNDPKPYKSYGNGSAMRISPVAYMAHNQSELEMLVDIVTTVTHNSKEGIKGAKVIASAIWMALHGCDKDAIRSMAEYHYPQIASFDYENLKKNYRFNETCQDTCPQAIYCFLISKDFLDCLRTSVSIGGDTDTLCAMSCAIAEAFYKDIPPILINDVLEKLPNEMIKVIERFYGIYEDPDLPIFELHKEEQP